ncbi:MAG: hypothetical protein ABF747_02255 [Bifidobacterium sp.]|uniref:Uncharacterized protein n=1 Tax=Bifidobacterium fermentum TaxID=3059035 RepID=A0AB39UHN6_9BIFI
MTTALGVDVDTDGNGVDPLTHRNIIMRHWNNTGIMGGLTVSGRSDLYYAVSAGVAVCSMGSADGYTEAYFAGGTTENAVSAGDGTYSRIDSIYLLANTGTPDNVVHCMVVQGTPSASPAAPTLPAGALPLQQMLVPAGASKTSSASVNGSQNYAIPYGGSLGQVGRSVDNSDYSSVWTDTAFHNMLLCTFSVPTDRMIHVDYQCSPYALGDGGSVISRIMIDEQTVKQAEIWCNNIADMKYLFYDGVVAAGSHTCRIMAAKKTGEQVKYVGSSASYIGRAVQVWDRGVSQ